MSPNEYNEDIFSLRERETIVTDIRSSYSFIFNQLVQIYKIHHQDEKLSTKAEEVADAVETLHNEGKITDYLYENFKSCYSQYPTMLVGNLVKEKEQVRLAKMEKEKLEAIDKEKFNFFKNQSLYFVWVVLGVPIVLGTKPSELEARTVELLKDEEIIAYASADGEMGKVVYYYSPWHALFGRDFGTKQLMLCLNRCHGDSPMNILPDRDFANKKPDPFSVYDLYEKKTLAYRAGHFEIYVETSDHPLNPNARLLLIDEAKC